MGIIAQGSLEDGFKHGVLVGLRGISGPLTGTSRREQDKATHINFGYLRGLSDGLAIILTDERVRKFPHLKWVDQINGYEVSEVIRDARSNWQVAEDRDAFLDKVVADLHAIVDGKNGEIARLHESIRREKVLKGEIEPEQDDIDWLEEEWRKRMEGSSSMQALVEKVRGTNK